jgi:hypothetical protein
MAAAIPLAAVGVFFTAGLGGALIAGGIALAGFSTVTGWNQ